MANIQHLYRGVGDPHDNPGLELTGDAVGNHLYQDMSDGGSVWMSLCYEEEGQVHHGGWERMLRESDFNLGRVGQQEPQLEGQLGFSHADGAMYVAMRDQDSDYALRWRSTGMVLGDWYTP